MICTNVPIYSEKWLNEPMWSVELNDGRTIYQSDEDGNSWIALKKYVDENGLWLKNMLLRFRDHVEVVGSDAPAYFFVHSILASFIGYQQKYFNAGTLGEDGIIRGNKWLIPEVMPMEEFVKNPADGYNLELIIRGKESFQK